MFVCSPEPSTAIANRIGATARSWKSRTEKLARPAGALSRLASARTGTTIAVEDSARTRPAKTAAVTAADDEIGDRGDRERAYEDLQRAQPEDEPAEDAQALPRKLDADREEKEDDGEIGQMRDLLAARNREPAKPGIIGHEAAKPIGAEKRAGAEETENRAQP